MALLNEEMDGDLMRLWGLIAELAEQTNANLAMTTALQQQASQAKGQVIHSGTGFVLRRFNTDLSQEVFESELERMNASLIIENQNLLHENKQLNSLLKEYEQTLETVMAKFRSQAHAAQQHELNLTRHYETLLLSRESNTLQQDLLLSSSQSESLARLAHYVRMTIRSLAGEDPDVVDGGASYPSFSDMQQQAESSSQQQHPEGYREGGYSGSPPPLEDWALEREIEITRLEKENEELRRLLSIGEDEDLMKDIIANSNSSVGPWGDHESSGSPSGSRAGSPSPSLARLAQGMPVRRGLLSQNRARMMGAAGGTAVVGQSISRPGSGMGMGGQGGPFGPSISPGPGQMQGQGQQQWGAQDPIQQRKMAMGSYFKEFPT